MNEIITGDCLEVMKSFPDNHFSAIVTDPPYGLHFMGKDWDNYAKGKVKVGRKILGTHSNSEAHEAARYDEARNDEFQDFMTEVSLEALRVSKPGAHLLMFGAPRRFHRQVCALEDAGWEIRDCLMWIFASGFPKSHNHFGIEGFGTALKPAHEPIIVGQKPYEISHLIAIISYDLTHEIHRNVCQRSNVNVNAAEANLKDSLALLNKELPFTVQENVKIYAWEKLADASYVARNTIARERASNSANSYSAQGDASTNGCGENLSENLILHGGAEIIFANIQDIYMSVIINDISENIALLWKNTLEDVLREMNRFTTKTVLRLTTELRTLKSCLSPNISSDTGNFSPEYQPIIMAMKPLDGTFKQNAEKWGQAGINIDGCRVGSDDTRAPASKNTLGLMNDDGWKCKPMIVGSSKGRWPANIIFDEKASELLGAPSRFFYCAKTSSRERNEGLEGLPEKIANPNFGSGGFSRPTNQPERETKPSKNHHPTVKPLKLMEYLIKLVMPPSNGLLLDPFAGSGSTILAAKRLGISAIGIEKQPEYAEIARARINALKPEEGQLDMFNDPLP